MDIITLDFETYFDKDYTLVKLTTEEYVRDERFEVLGCGVRFSTDGSLHWYRGDDLKTMLRGLNERAVLAHHAHFDGLILNHHFGVRPKYWLDTLSMARMVIGNHLPKGLGVLAKHFGLPEKNIPYHLFKGKHWHELTPEIQQQISSGCLHDVDLTYTIFTELFKYFPRCEYPLIDMTIRMFTEPVLEGDLKLLGEIWHEENNKKTDLRKELGVTETQLQSNDQFAELLRGVGIEPDLKQSKSNPEKLTYAFAKTDQFIRDLQDEDSQAGSLVRARLGVKSTIIQTRASRFGNMAYRGAMPVYINYCGAHTTRWSGGDKSNWQNLKRGDRLRESISAAKGFVCVVVDASQIECRILNQFAGQKDVIQRFKNNEDPYVHIASQFYGETIYKPSKDDPRKQELEAKRGTGKQLELSCGYGAGDETIQTTAKLGIYGPPVYMPLQEAGRAKELYRSTHVQVTRLWSTAGRLIARLAGGPPMDWDYGVSIRDGRLYGPGGQWIDYTTLKYDKELKSWVFKKRNGWKTIWGGFLVENLIQFLARIHLSETMVRLQRAGIPKICLCTHDDIFAIVPERDGQAWLDYMIQELSTSPEWMPEVPLAAEGDIGRTYGEAK